MMNANIGMKELPTETHLGAQTGNNPMRHCVVGAARTSTFLDKRDKASISSFTDSKVERYIYYLFEHVSPAVHTYSREKGIADYLAELRWGIALPRLFSR
jgi:hypothetical protein